MYIAFGNRVVDSMDMKKLIEAGATRIGTSSGCKIIDALVKD